MGRHHQEKEETVQDQRPAEGTEITAQSNNTKTTKTQSNQNCGFKAILGPSVNISEGDA